jgi:hypothetical protein
MPLYKQCLDSLVEIPSIALDSENNLQNLIEKNLLETFLDIRLIQSDYYTHFGRIDTLGIDADNAPVIIGYKLDKHDNTVNKCIHALKWLISQKSSFIKMLVQDTLGKEVAEKIQHNLNLAHAICIGEAFSIYDITTVESIPLYVDLIKYRKFGQELFLLEAIALHGKDYKNIN